MPSRKGASIGGGGKAVGKAGGKRAAISKGRAKAAISKAEHDAALKELEAARPLMDELMRKMREPTPIPGWSYMDVLGGTRGCAHLGHSIYDMEDPQLKDPKLHGRCQEWMALSLPELKAACKKHSLLLEGSKKVLALRLAIKAPMAKP